MAYSTRDLIETKFGKANVRKWADLDGNKDQEDITARITAAIAYGDAEIDMTLGGRFSVPFASTPTVIEEISVQLAGVRLYEGRGVPDADEDGNVRHRLAWHRDQAQRKLRAIAAGAYNIGVSPQVVSHPSVINVECPRGVYAEPFPPYDTIE